MYSGEPQSMYIKTGKSPLHLNNENVHYSTFSEIKANQMQNCDMHGFLSYKSPTSILRWVRNILFCFDCVWIHKMICRWIYLQTISFCIWHKCLYSMQCSASNTKMIAVNMYSSYSAKNGANGLTFVIWFHNTNLTVYITLFLLTYQLHDSYMLGVKVAVM